MPTIDEELEQAAEEYRKQQGGSATVDGPKVSKHRGSLKRAEGDDRDIAGIGAAVKALRETPENWNKASGFGESYKVISDLARAIGEPVGKLFLPAAATKNPIGTLTGLATALGGSAAGGLAADALEASPGYKRLAEDVGGAMGGFGVVGANAVQRGIAPELVSSAAKARPVNRQWGKDLGRATLEETVGNTPAAVVASASERLGQLRSVKEGLLSNAPDVDRSPIMRELAKWLQISRDQGSSTLGQAVREFEPSVMGNTETGAVYGPRMPALAADHALQGFGKDHVRFIEGRTPAGNEAAKAIRGVWRDAIETAAPETGPLNRRSTNLADVPDLFRRVGNQAGSVENVVDRATRPTGGMAPALAAMMHGGPGAGLLTLAVQEGIGSPTFKVALARALWKAGGGKKVGAP